MRERLRVTLTDGRDVGIPHLVVCVAPRRTDAQRADLMIIDDGLGIWWEQLDDGICSGLLGLPHV